MAAHEDRAAKRLKTGVDHVNINALGPSHTAADAPVTSNPNIWGSDDDDSVDIPSDTVAAMSLLKRDFPKLDGVSGALLLVLKSLFRSPPPRRRPPADASVRHQVSALHRATRPHHGRSRVRLVKVSFSWRSITSHRRSPPFSLSADTPTQLDASSCPRDPKSMQ